MVISMIGYISVIQFDNGATTTIDQNPLVNNTYQGLKVNVTSAGEKSQTQLGLFNNETPNAGIGSIVLFTIVGSGKTFGTIITGVFLLIINTLLYIIRNMLLKSFNFI